MNSLLEYGIASKAALWFRGSAHEAMTLICMKAQHLGAMLTGQGDGDPSTLAELLSAYAVGPRNPVPRWAADTRRL